MSVKEIDSIVLIAAHIIPIYLVLRFKRIGFIVGVLFLWFSLILEGVFLSYADPERDAGLLDSIWLLFGWMYGLMYCGIFFLLKQAVFKIKSKEKAG